ncbi:TetR/AcrR family transcriptional regulator [Spongiibacter marinus]|uniref:TetR/AcrR family transcriptional regulator n=1 Tax=Spongiibacter marinus TaxID=354246 RepID=UPI000482F7DB|nr:TetR family transcriptional regulator [Spongiibacter marinus]
MSGSLNRQRFVDAALDVIADVGVEKLSMRRVASQLGVSAMAMYKHFANKDELLGAAFEEFIARAEVLPDDQLPWDEWLTVSARGMYQALCSEMSWVPWLGKLRLGGNALRVTERFAAKLAESGLATDASVRVYMATIQLVVGAVCMRASLHASHWQQGEGAAATPEALPPEIYTGLANAVAQEPIDVSLPLLIEGVRHQLLLA